MAGQLCRDELSGAQVFSRDRMASSELAHLSVVGSPGHQQGLPMFTPWPLRAWDRPVWVLLSRGGLVVPVLYEHLCHSHQILFVRNNKSRENFISKVGKIDTYSW